MPTHPDPEPLPEPVAARLLARASELDAALRAGSVAVDDLRAAAGEAGISARAFDAALAELREGEEARVPDVGGPRRRRRRPWALVAAGVALFVVSTWVVARRAVPPDVPAVGGVPMVHEAILLRCLSATEAIALIRPHLTHPENTAQFARGSRVLTVRATPAQLLELKAALEQYEGTGSPTCPSRPPGAATP
jgi:hypothetical protein